MRQGFCREFVTTVPGFEDIVVGKINYYYLPWNQFSAYADGKCLYHGADSEKMKEAIQAEVDHYLACGLVEVHG